MEMTVLASRESHEEVKNLEVKNPASEWRLQHPKASQ